MLNVTIRRTRAIAAISLLAGAGQALAQDKILPTWVLDHQGGNVRYSRNGAYFLVGYQRLYDAVKKTQVGAMPWLPNGPEAMALAPDGKSAYFMPGTQGLPPHIVKYDFIAGRVETVVPLHAAQSLGVSPDGKFLVFADMAGTAQRINVFDLTTKTFYKRWTLPSNSATVAAIRFMPDSKRFVTPGPTIYDIDGNRLAARTPLTGFIELSPTGDAAYTLGSNRLYKYRTSDNTLAWSVPFEPFSMPKLNSDGTVLRYPGRQGYTWSINSIDAATGKLLPTYVALPAAVDDLALSPISNEMLLWGNDTTMRVFNVAADGSGLPVQDLQTNPNWFTQVAPISVFRNNGIVPAIVTFSGTTDVHLNRASTGGRLAGIKLPQDATIDILGDPATSADGKHLIFRGYRGSNYGVNVVDVTTGKWVTSRTGNFVSMRMAAGDRLTLLDSIGRIHYWKYANNLLTPLKSFAPGGAKDASLSPDGTLFSYHRTANAADAEVRVASTVDGSIKWRQSFVNNNFFDTYVRSWISPTGLLGIVSSDVLPTSPFADRYFKFSIYKLDGGVPALIRTLQYSSVGRFAQNNADISPDGQYALIWNNDLYSGAEYRPYNAYKLDIYRISDGSLVRGYRGPFNQTPLRVVFSADSRFVHVYTHGQILTFPTLPDAPGLSITPANVIGGTKSTGLVRIDQPAGTGGQIVLLNSSSPNLIVPASVIVPAGKTAVGFTINSKPVDGVTTATVTATIGTATSTAEIDVLPPAMMLLSMDRVYTPAGTPTQGTVRLSTPAGPSGLRVEFKSSSVVEALNPVAVTIPPGGTTARFTLIPAETPSGAGVLVSAVAPSLGLTGMVHVASLPAEVYLVAAKSEAKGGLNLAATATIQHKIGTGPVTYTLTSTSTALIPPATVIATTQGVTLNLTLKSIPVTQDTTAVFTLTSPSGFSTSIPLKVLAPVVTTVVPKVTSVVGGNQVSVTVNIDSPAAAGFTLPASSSDPAVTIPAFSFAANAKVVTVNLATSKVTVQKTVTVTIGGKSFNLTVKP